MVVDVPETSPVREKHVVFYDASWDFYESILRELGEQPIRVNFDRGTLEIMTLSVEHEAFKQAIGMMIGLISLEFGIPIAQRGSATLKLQPKERGLESDQSYWIANESAIRSIKRLDLRVHPPPDLVVEVDITHAVVDRESTYAALGVPEMWHFDATTKLTAWQRIGDSWNRIERSISFPMLKVSDLNPFLDRLSSEGELAVMSDFRQWMQSLPR